MPAVKTASSLDAKLAARGLGNAADVAKDAEVDMGFGGDLPPFINGGVAKLAEIKIGEYQKGDKKGESFVRLAGVVQTPVVFKDQRIAGSQAAIMIPLCDDPPNVKRGAKPGKKLADRVHQLLNEFKKMGAEESVRQLPKNPLFSQIMQIGAALVKVGPYFSFRTYAITDKPTPAKPNPEPGQTITEFKGIIANYDPNAEPSAPAVHDNSGQNGESAPEAEAPPDAVDWIVVGEAAENGDTEAQARIDAAGEALGLSGTEEWAALGFNEAAALIAQTEAGGGPEAGGDAPAEAPPVEAAPAETIPEKGQTWNYKPKSSRANPVEAEITAVYAASKKVNLKILSGPKAGTLVRSATWEELS